MLIPPTVITIDGPSGSGKGTIAQRLAAQLGFYYLDSGVLYRVLALAAKQRHISMDDEIALETLVKELDVKFSTPEIGKASQVTLDGQDVGSIIRTEEMGNGASQVSRHQRVRAALLERQRIFRQFPGLVTDGRDMGTVVFPDAQVKIFLLASAQERARRRCKQLEEQGLMAKGLNEQNINDKLAHFTAALIERDQRDSQRSVAPLAPAKDAYVIDTTGLSIEEVMAKVIEKVEPSLS